MLVPIRIDRRHSRRRRRPRKLPPVALPQRRKRRGATAMEYVVLLSFIFLVVFAAVQYMGGALGGSFSNSAHKVPSGKQGP